MSTSFPPTGRDPEAILSEMAAFRDQDADFRGGRTWSMVYYAGDAHHALMERAHNLYIAGNALNPMAFKSLKRMESEVVQMTADLLHGPPSTVGSLTSGGTESLLLVVKTYRDRARRIWPWIRRPNAVVPNTIHPAFEKAAHLFGVKLKRVKVGSSGAVDPKAMAKKVDRNTIFIAASAPQYVTGVVDPIPELSALALKKKLPLHVDACFGGFILPFLKDLGVQMPVFDFENPGVTSISADLHKYGYAPKGAAVLLFRDMAHMRHQFFISTGWPGGIYASPGMAGTRPGGPIAAAWAAVNAMGFDGYKALAKGAWDVAQKLREGLSGVPGIVILGQPHSTIVTWRNTEVDTYAVADILMEKGWSVDRQQAPPSIHCSVNANNAQSVQVYIDDVREAVTHVRAHPELASEGEAAMYGLMAKVPVKTVVSEAVRGVLEGMYAPGGAAPDLSDPLDGLPIPKSVVQLGERALDAYARLRS